MSSAERSPRAAVLTIGLAVLSYFAHVFYLDVPLADDAAISVAYGQTLLAGHGLRLTLESQPVEAFSNPLWVFLCAFGGARALGIIAGALTLLCVAGWSWLLRKGALRVEDALAALLLALTPNYVYWCSSGMESGLFSLLLTLSVAFWLREWRSKTGSFTGVFLGLVSLTRPEGVLYAAAAAVLWAAGLVRARRRPGAQEARMLLFGTLLFFGYVLFRWLYFARWLPNSYYAKRFWEFSAGDYLVGFVAAYPLAVIVIAGALAVAWSKIAAERGEALLLSTFIGCGLGFVVQAHGDWMWEFRFFAPLWPLGTIAVAIALGTVRTWVRVRWVPAAIGAVLILGLIPMYVARTRALREAPPFSARDVEERAHKVLAELKSFGIHRGRLALADIGGLGLVARNHEVIDVAGLADYAVAEHSGNQAAIEDYLMHEGLPDMLDVHGPSNYLEEYDVFLSRYERGFGPFYQLKGLGTPADPRCADQPPIDDPKVLEETLAKMVEERQGALAIRVWRCTQAYRKPDQLPDSRSRDRVAGRALTQADAALASGDRVGALRLLSLATILRDGDAHLRRRTEQLRATLFPPN